MDVSDRFVPAVFLKSCRKMHEHEFVLIIFLCETELLTN